MILILSTICIIEFGVIIYLITKNKKVEFNMEDYEYIIISICKYIIKNIDTSDIDINDVCDEVVKEFYHEMENCDVKIPNNINILNVKEYIKNLIIINNILSEVSNEQEDEDINTPVIDEPIVDINSSNYKQPISILEYINKFYD